jgi:pimeloyl-ACP methyl ester carboxylesterase
MMRPRRRAVKPAVVLVVAARAVAAFVLASFGSFWLAVRPPRIAIPLRPEDYRLTVERVRIRADDGVELAGWLLPRPGAPTVIMLHGYPAEKSDLLPLAAALAPSFATLLVDLRSFGESEGRVTTLGHRERQDLKRAITSAVARATAVGVFGLSLGGAVAP